MSDQDPERPKKAPPPTSNTDASEAAQLAIIDWLVPPAAPSSITVLMAGIPPPSTPQPQPRPAAAVPPQTTSAFPSLADLPPISNKPGRYFRRNQRAVSEELARYLNDPLNKVEFEGKRYGHDIYSSIRHGGLGSDPGHPTARSGWDVPAPAQAPPVAAAAEVQDGEDGDDAAGGGGADSKGEGRSHDGGDARKPGNENEDDNENGNGKESGEDHNDGDDAAGDGSDAGDGNDAATKVKAIVTAIAYS